MIKPSGDERPGYTEAMNLFTIQRCILCQTDLFSQDPLCRPCFEKIRLLQAPERWQRPDHIVFSLFRYGDQMQELIQRMKFHEQRYLAAVMARFIVRFLKQNGLPLDYVSYVPMHRFKRWVRGFDQARDLADETARLLSLPRIDILERIRLTRSLYPLDRRQRRDIMTGSMRVSQSKPPGYVMIVDDIVTTGATIGACAAALNQAGMEDYFFLVLAKAIQPG